MKYLLFILFFIAECFSAYSQSSLYKGGSHFEFGFARLRNRLTDDTTNTQLVKSRQYYIDTNGQVAFNDILRGEFYEKKEAEDYLAAERDSTLLPEHYVVVQKGSKLGVLTINGKWILKPVYDSIDTRNPFQWIVKRGGKRSLFTFEGFQLPFRFDMAFSMDGNYFSVVNNGRWGIYSKREDSLVVPCIYQNMDYCYGCESKGDYCFAEKSSKWGVINFKNKMVLPFEYDHQHWNMRSDEWVYCLYKKGKQLVINLNTKQIDTFRYTKVSDEDTTDLAQGFKRIKKEDKYGLTNSEGKLILDYNYDFIRYDADTLGFYLPSPYIAINQNNLWGVADTTGKIIIQPQYNSGLNMIADSFFLCEKDGKMSLLNKDGVKVLPGLYDKIKFEQTECSCDSLTTCYLKLKANNRYGFYNPLTMVLVEPRFDNLDNSMYEISFSHCVKIEQHGLEGVLDIQTGMVVMPPLFQSIANKGLHEGMMIVGDDGKYGLYNYVQRKLMAPLKYNYISLPYGENAFLIRTDTGKGLMDFTGRVICPPDYFSIRLLNDTFYLLTKQDSAYHETYSFLNRSNDKIIAASYDSIEAVEADTLAIIRQNGKDRLWNPLSGKMIEGDYSKWGFPDFIDYFNNGRAIVQKNKKSGFIDGEGNIIIPLKYDGLSDFYKGYAIMLQGKDSLGQQLYGFIDTTGKVVVPAKYVYDERKDIRDYFTDTCLLLLERQDSFSKQQVGLALRNGKILIPPIYDKIFFQKNGPDYIVEKDRKFGVLTSQGQILLPVVFDNIALNRVPIYETDYVFNFPLLVKKGKIWQYYKRDGDPLPIKVEENIPLNSVFAY